jgi:purine-nucleoside phosphorylase
MATNDVVSRLDETVTAIRSKIALAPRIGIVLGSGLGGFGDRLRNVVRIPYGELPHMPVPTVSGHAGAVCVGFVDDVPVICMEGRSHMYEGHPAWQVVHGARVMARLGIRSALLTNAAGAIDPQWELGTMMVVADHLDFMAHEPLGGLGPAAVSPFPDMRKAYDASLREYLHEAALKESTLAARISQNAKSIELEEGIYAALRDPSCETPAQVNMLASAGASAVGMSTVPEVTALRQLGVGVAALSYISHHAAGVRSELPEDEATSRLVLGNLHRVVRAWVLRADRS